MDEGPTRERVNPLDSQDCSTSEILPFDTVVIVNERGVCRAAISPPAQPLGIAPVDASDHLDNEEVVAEYLAAALEDPNPDVVLHAVADVAKARGISRVSKEAGLGRESLYQALAPGAKIRYDTVRKLMDSVGVRLTVTTN